MVGDLALLYNSRVKGKPKTLHTEWMGPYIVEEIHPNGSVQLKTLQGLVFQKLKDKEAEQVEFLGKCRSLAQSVVLDPVEDATDRPLERAYQLFEGMVLTIQTHL